MIKTFRGLIGYDDGTGNTQETIPLHTNDGKTGYRIVKFELMPYDFGASNNEHLVKIFTVKQTVVNPQLDFSDQTLLAAAIMNNVVSPGSQDTPIVSSVIFDRNVFNQDIYIVHNDRKSTSAVNYYLELEQVKLDLNENTVATLKNLRNLEPGQI